MPNVSVIVRTCGRPWFLRRSLASIAAQTVRPAEVILVNDDAANSSVDEAAIFGQQLGLTVRVIHNRSKLGRGGSLNVGIRAASSEWLAFLDDDDTWNNDFLRHTLAGAWREGEPGIQTQGIVTQTVEVFEKAAGEGWKQYRARTYNKNLRSISLQELAVRNRFTNNAFVFTASAFQCVGPYREDLPVLEDWEFNVRFAARFRIALVALPLAHYHKRPKTTQGSLSNSALAQHRLVRRQVRDDWLRADMESGRFGLGGLSLLSEIQENRGLRLIHAVLDRFFS